MQGGQPVVTFDARGRIADTIEQLVTDGFVLEPASELRTSLLDTFDGRLHRRGVQLRVEQGARLDLVLAADGCDLARTGVDAIPRWATDLPPGDPWSVAAKPLDVRAMSPRVVVRARRRRAYRRNSTGDLVAVADLLDDLVVEGRRPTRLDTTLVEVRSIGRSGRAARRVADALGSIGLPRHDRDTLGLGAATAGVDLRGFTPTAVPMLQAEMSAADGVRAVLTPLAETIAANWDGTIQQIDTEFLHQLRVAIRRTRTILAAAEPVLPPEMHRRVADDVAWLASLTSTPRDLDVCLLNWAADTADMDDDTERALAPVRDVVERRRSESYEILATAMRSRRARSLRHEWPRWLTEPLVGDVPAGADRALGPFAAQLVQRGHRQLVRDGRAIDDSSPATDLHELRKDAKRLRYLVDGFASIVPTEDAARLVSSLKALQEVLGRHQDADVHASILAATASDLVEHAASPATFIALGRMLERHDERRRRARSEFAVVFARFDRPRIRRAVDAIGDASS